MSVGGWGGGASFKFVLYVAPWWLLLLLLVMLLLCFCWARLSRWSCYRCLVKASHVTGPCETVTSMTAGSMLTDGYCRGAVNSAQWGT